MKGIRKLLDELLDMSGLVIQGEDKAAAAKA